MNVDKKLQADVVAELSWEPSVNAAQIGVIAKEGVITLTGYVENYMQKSAAERAVGRVKGVRAVAEEIEVRLPMHVKKSDDEIAAALLNRLEWNTAIPKEAIRAKVENGWVTLTGAVDWQYQKTAVETDIRGMFGVVSIANNITIKSMPDASDIRTDIEHALHRHWYDPKTVSVTVDGGAVSLSGTVHTIHDRELASMAAWSASGTQTVVNNLSII